MNEYYAKHKHLIYLWLFFLIIAIVSGNKILSSKKNEEVKKTKPTQNLESNATAPGNIVKETKNDGQKKEYAKKINNIVEEKTISGAVNAEQTTTTNEIKQNETVPPEPPIATAIIYIGDEKTILPIGGKTSLYEAMAQLQNESKLTFSGVEYPGLGYFIKEINGVKNDAKEGYYHIYYINGESAKVGISNYIIKPNDIIVWKYEKSKF